MSNSSVLVSGATGKQGGALIRALLAARHAGPIYALTRDANSAAAKALPEAAVVVQGDLDAPDAIFEGALEGKPVDVILSIQQPWGGQEAKEVTQGKVREPVFRYKPQSEGIIAEPSRPCRLPVCQGLFDSAVNHGVKHFIYSSVNRHGDGPTPVPHFASKALIEEHIKANGGDKILSTILRPVAFSDNWPAPGDPAAALLGACLEVGLKPTTKLQLVSTVDIGKLAALIIHDRARFAGRTVDVVGDSLTWPEIQRVYREVVGVEAPTIPDFKLANAGPEMETMCVFLCASSPRPIVREALIRFPSPFGDVGSDGSRRSATTPRSTRCTRSSRRRTLPAISAERTSMRRDRPTFYRCTRSFIPHTNACFSFFS